MSEARQPGTDPLVLLLGLVGGIVVVATFALSESCGVALLTLLVLSPFLVVALRALPAAGPSAAEPSVEPGLRDFASRLTRLKIDKSAARVEGRFGGERVSAEVWPEPSEVRAWVRVEAAVPMQLTGTFVFVRGEDGPKLASGRPIDAVYKQEKADVALRTLLQRVDEVEVGLSGIEARSRAPLVERSFVVSIEALVTLASCVRTDTPAPPDPVARLLATRTRAPADGPKVIVRGGQLCPFCRDGIEEDAHDVVACAACTTLHHAECWTENGGRCTVSGCGRDRAERVPSG